MGTPELKLPLKVVENVENKEAPGYCNLSHIGFTLKSCSRFLLIEGLIIERVNAFKLSFSQRS